MFDALMGIGVPVKETYTVLREELLVYITTIEALMDMDVGVSYQGAATSNRGKSLAFFYI